MKKITMTMTALMVVFVAFQSQAQLRFGARAGLNIANFSVSAGTAPSSVYSFHVGGVAEYSLAETFAIEGGLQISGKGAKQDVVLPLGTATVTISVSSNPLYLEIPINAVYKLNLGSMDLNIFAGPYLAFGVAGSNKLEYSSTGTMPTGFTLPANESKSIKYGSDAASDLASTDFGLNIGAGIEVSNFQVRLQYGLGLSDLSPVSGGTTVKNAVFAVGLGYMFGEKK